MKPSKPVLAVLVLAAVAGAVLLAVFARRAGPLELPVPEGYERQEGLPDYVGDEPPKGPVLLAIFWRGKNGVEVSVFPDYTKPGQFDMVCLGRSLDFDRVKNLHELVDEKERIDTVAEEFHQDKTLCYEVYLTPVEDCHKLRASYYFPTARGVFEVAFGSLVTENDEYEEELAFQRDYVERLRAAAEK